MFIRIEDTAINLSLVEQIIFAKSHVIIDFASKDAVFLDLKHTEKLERALITYNQKGGHVHDEV